MCAGHDQEVGESEGLKFGGPIFGRVTVLVAKYKPEQHITVRCRDEAVIVGDDALVELPGQAANGPGAGRVMFEDFDFGEGT